MENIDINEYLKEARKNARKFGFDGTIDLSDRIDKKLKFTDRVTGKVIHFGAKDYYDKIMYRMLFGSEYAEKKSTQYRSRARSIYNKAPFLSPSSLSWLVLW